MVGLRTVSGFPYTSTMTILIAYLPTPEGAAALTVGFAEARLRGESVVVLNSPVRGSAEAVAAISEGAQGEIEALAAESGVSVTIVHPDTDADIVDTLNELVTEHAASLIVIGLRKRSAIGKFILGSQAQRILLDAEVPVLTAKA